jgi:hypothetical protein
MSPIIKDNILSGLTSITFIMSPIIKKQYSKFIRSPKVFYMQLSLLYSTLRMAYSPIQSLFGHDEGQISSYYKANTFGESLKPTASDDDLEYFPDIEPSSNDRDEISFLRPSTSNCRAVRRKRYPLSRSICSSPDTSGTPSAESYRDDTPRRVGHFAPLCRVQRIKSSTTARDIRKIYQCYTRTRPRIEIDLPIWIPDPMKSTNKNSPKDPPKVTAASVVNRRVKELLSFPGVQSIIASTSPQEVTSAIKIVKTCQALDIHQPNSKKELFPWLYDSCR